MWCLANLKAYHYYVKDQCHCVKSVQIRSYFWFAFSCIWTEYGDLLRKSLYSIRIQEKRTRNNSIYGHFSRSVSSIFCIFKMSFWSSECSLQSKYLIRFCISSFFLCACLVSIGCFWGIAVVVMVPYIFLDSAWAYLYYFPGLYGKVILLKFRWPFSKFTCNIFHWN